MKRPNILFLIADQHRYDCVGYSNRNKNGIKTPNIDKLCEEGIWFNNAYTTSPVCCPARQSLIAGRRPETFGALWNYNITLPVGCLEPEDFSYARLLKENGYNNTFVGVWDICQHAGPASFGFDNYIPSIRTYSARSQEGEVIDKPFNESDTYKLGEKVCEEIERLSKANKPWHMSVNFSEPHPYYAPVNEFAEMYRPEDMKPWDGFYDDLKNKPYIQTQQILNWGNENKGWDYWAPIVAKYHAFVSQVDSVVGMILDKLAETGNYEDTLVVYTSDHGDMCGSHGMFDKHYVMYEDVTHVPFVMRWPGRISGGIKTDAYTVHFLDLVPTVLDVCSIGKPEDATLHGRSLRPIIMDEGIPKDWRQEAVSSYNGQQFGLFCQRSIKTDRWKYVWNPTDIDEVYDLENDPGETRNLVNEVEIDILSDLRKRLYETLAKDEDWLVMRNNHSWVAPQLLHNKKHAR